MAEFARVYDLLGLGQNSILLADLALCLASTVGFELQCTAVLGCKTGAAALVLARAGLQVLGLDANAAMLDEAHAKAQRQRLQVHWVLADLCCPRQALAAAQTYAGTCDLVLVSGVVGALLSTRDLDRAMTTAAGLLRPGGMALIDVIDATAMRAWEQVDRVLHDDSDYLAFMRVAYSPVVDRVDRRVVWFVRELTIWWRAEMAWRERPWDDDALRSSMGQADLRVRHCLKPFDCLSGQLIYVAEKGGEQADGRC